MTKGSDAHECGELTGCNPIQSIHKLCAGHSLCACHALSGCHASGIVCQKASPSESLNVHACGYVIVDGGSNFAAPGAAFIVSAGLYIPSTLKSYLSVSAPK